MVMSGGSVHLTTFFLGKLEYAVNQYFVHILSLVTDNNPSWISEREENGRMINQSPLKYGTGPGSNSRPPGSAVRHVSAFCSQTHYRLLGLTDFLWKFLPMWCVNQRFHKKLVNTTYPRCLLLTWFSISLHVLLIFPHFGQVHWNIVLTWFWNIGARE